MGLYHSYCSGHMVTCLLLAVLSPVYTKQPKFRCMLGASIFWCFINNDRLALNSPEFSLNIFLSEFPKTLLTRGLGSQHRQTTLC